MPAAMDEVQTGAATTGCLSGNSIYHKLDIVGAGTIVPLFITRRCPATLANGRSAIVLGFWSGTGLKLAGTADGFAVDLSPLRDHTPPTARTGGLPTATGPCYSTAPAVAVGPRRDVANKLPTADFSLPRNRLNH
jgi:hypothetical protein